MDGPLVDDWYISTAVSPPSWDGGGRTLVIRWNEPGPMPDQRRVYTFPAALESEAICEHIRELLEAYLISRASGVRRVIARLERAGTLRL